MEEQVNSQIDSRKLQKLVDDGVITDNELDNASVVLVCSCGQEQSVYNNNCEKCAKDIS